MSEEQPQPTSDETTATAETSPTWHANGSGGETGAATSSATAQTSESEASPLPGDDGTGFLEQLAKAMKDTAGAERTRVTEDADRRREAYITSIHARRDMHAATMRKLSQDDLKAIESWAEGERQRIEQESERRAAGVRQDLEVSLAEHRAKVDREIEAVDSAISAYRSEVDVFFTTLDQETDPVSIAQHAARRPVFPDLEAVGAATENGGYTPVTTPAPSSGEGEGGAPVMESKASTEPRSSTKLAQAWAAWSASVVDTDGAAATDEEDAAAEAEPVPVPAGTFAPESEEDEAAVGDDDESRDQGSGGPMSWLRRDRDHGG